MKRNISVFFAAFLICSVCWIASAEEMAPWVKGETWNYHHEGPVPFRGPESTIDGDRVLKVLNVKEADSETMWTLNENWGESDDAPRTLTVDADRKIHRMLWGDDGIQYDPPMRMDYTSLKPGEETTETINVKFGDGGMKSIIVAKRMPDEDVTVPAGTFKSCSYVKIDMKLKMGEMEMPINHEIWYHPKANFMVKEKYEFKAIQVGDREWGGHTSVSELKSHTKP